MSQCLTRPRAPLSLRLLRGTLPAHPPPPPPPPGQTRPVVERRESQPEHGYPVGANTTILWSAVGDLWNVPKRKNVKSVALVRWKGASHPLLRFIRPSFFFFSFSLTSFPLSFPLNGELFIQIVLKNSLYFFLPFHSISSLFGMV